MADEELDVRMEEERDRRAVYLGTAVTAIATLVLFVVPDLIPVEAIRRWTYQQTGRWPLGTRGNPFSWLRLCGGLFGGAVAGWLTSEYGSPTYSGLKAAVFGLGLAYLIVVGFYVFYWPVLRGVFPPPMFEIMVVPIIHSILLFPAHIAGGPLAGAIASEVRTIAGVDS